MQCKFCRGDLPEGAKVCPICGTPAPEEEERNISEENEGAGQENNQQYSYGMSRRETGSRSISRIMVKGMAKTIVTASRTTVSRDMARTMASRTTVSRDMARTMASRITVSKDMVRTTVSRDMARITVRRIIIRDTIIRIMAASL